MKRAELLIDPVNVMVGTDQGIAWVCDRYILLRADLFTHPPKVGDALLSKHIRSTLAHCRVNPVALTGRPPFKSGAHLWCLPAKSTNWRLKNGNGSSDLLVQQANTGSLLINERVARGLWLADAKPYITAGRMAWWQKRRGKPVLVAVQMPVRITDFSTEWEQTS